jgi:hypothetical protein
MTFRIELYIPTEPTRVNLRMPLYGEVGGARRGGADPMRLSVTRILSALAIIIGLLGVHATAFAQG